MSRIVVLDTGVLGVLSNPRATPENEDARGWMRGLLAGGDTVAVPEIADYEVRRELLRGGKTTGLRRLDLLVTQLQYVPLTTMAMRTAAAFWAQVRQQGLATARDAALDGDVILAAQVAHLTTESEEVVVATTNVRHLALFTDAQRWLDV